MTEPIVLKISEAEWEVMRVIWAKEQATSPEVISILSSSMNWKPATVKTLLSRLVKKDILLTEVDGNKFIYHPLVSEEQTMRSATEHLFSKICAKKVGKTIAELIAEADLTQADLERISAAVSQKKETAVETIACNCIPGQCECYEHQTNH